MWAIEGTDVDAAVAAGYTDQGTRFYALPKSDYPTCAAPVTVFTKQGKHRYAASDAERTTLAGSGWTDQGTAFAAAPVTTPTAGSSFTLAVMPDTQQETGTTDPRLANRTAWLAANKTALNLQFVSGSGDTVNWGWLVPSQYSVASAAMQNLENAGLPYSLAIGNHDTRAVGWDGVPGSRGYGGSAYMFNPECPERLGAAECNSTLLVRHTEEFNAVFNKDRFRNVAGVYEAGKVDNIYSTFTAGGKNWMVLSLELWPRTAVIEWAKSVVAANPTTNVIVQTHSYLTNTGAIYTSNGGYGTNSPKYLFDNLISKYPNIKMVLSGHVGQAASRVDTGVAGNKIVSYLQCFHSNTTNPVRLVTINPAQGTLTSRVYAPYTSEDWTQYSTSTTGMSFVG